MNQDEINEAASRLAAHAIRNITPTEIETLYPRGYDALHVHEAILTAHLTLNWPEPKTITRARTLAVVTSPVLVPFLAIMWTAWKLSNAIGTRRGKRRIHQTS